MRIKITGYLDTEEMDSEDVDLGHPTGLSTKGYDDVTSMEGTLRVSELEDIEVRLER
jgi:hypothetical protein